MNILQTKCPNCGKSNWTTSGQSHFLTQAIKNKKGEYKIKDTVGMVVRSYICNKCSYVVFFKEKYDKDLR